MRVNKETPGPKKLWEIAFDESYSLWVRNCAQKDDSMQRQIKAFIRQLLEEREESK